ncbi:MAG: efflux RND transporter permease subunit, partial [Proteobacteria bacterium]
AFNWMQDRLEDFYVWTLRGVIRVPWLVIIIAILLFVGSLLLVKKVPKTFLPPQDFGEFLVSIDLPPGTSIDTTSARALKLEEIIRSYPEVDHTSLTVGKEGEIDYAEFFVQLVPRKKRNEDTSQFKDKLRKRIAGEFGDARPIVKDIDIIGGNLRPFMVNVLGQDFGELENYAGQLYKKLKQNPALKDVDISYSPGKPEVQISIDQKKAERLGVMVNTVGMELRGQVEGVTPIFYRENGEEYDVRVRMKDDQRNLAANWDKIFVPNMNFFNVRIMSNDIQLPEGIKYIFVGQAESYAEMVQNMIIALALAVVFIYLVLCSLYESFVTPLTIMLVLPLAICGAFAALYLTNKSLDLFSMIGCILLLGVAIKNSILLV